MSETKNFNWQLPAVAAVLVAGVLLSLLAGFISSAVGVLLCVLTSLFALSMKGWAVKKKLDVALFTVGVSFAVRLFTVGAGIAVAHRFGASVPLVVGFFGAFMPLLVIEMAYVLRAHRALTPSGSAS